MGLSHASHGWRRWIGAELTAAFAIRLALVLPLAVAMPAGGGRLSVTQHAGQTTQAGTVASQAAERLNVLLLGIDQRPGQNPDRTRTDTMIVMTFDPETHTAGMLSIPRDLYVSLPGRGRGRINTAHVYGGPAYAMRTVAGNFDLPIQHYVRVNFNALTTLVDLVGGIDVEVDQDIDDQTYPDNTNGYDPFVISAGRHHMDGATVLKYARTRHGSSDFYRMRRQQQIIIALRDRVLSTDVLTTLLQNAPQILDTLKDSISTDLSLPEIIQLILFAKDLPEEKVNRVVVGETAVRRWTTRQGAQVLVPIPGRLHELAAQLYTLPMVAKAGVDGHGGPP
ncbi:MAG: LCP family protein [Chloroflexi bacterium]|nr:LCP family protein [Chloroflexota bacterium]